MAEKIDLKDAFEKRHACYFVSPTITDKNGDLLVCIAIFNEPSFVETSEIMGKDLKHAAELIRQRNLMNGISEKRAMDIIQSSMNLQDEMDNLIKEIENGGR